MNLYGRLAATLVKGAFCQPGGFFEATYSSFRVLPQDCDMNLHLTNSSYFAFCDLARLHSFMRSGVLFSCLQRGWYPIVNAQEIRFIKGIKPFERFTIETNWVGWDLKYLYCEQKFTVNSKTAAVVHVRGGLVGKQGAIPPRMFSEAFLSGVDSPPLPKHLRTWDEIMDFVKHDAIKNDAVPI